MIFFALYMNFLKYILLYILISRASADLNYIYRTLNVCIYPSIHPEQDATTTITL